MTERKEKALRVIDEKRELLCTVSEEIWDHPEVLFHEEYASDILSKTLEDEGFQVTRELAGIKTAFSGRFGAGKPVIGFLGEFDALPGMSQQAGIFEKKPVEAGQPGHGCGHNLLGVGSLGAALAVKRYLTENKLPGTVIYFGCPAEEGGSGKGFMARAHVFDDVDVAFTWHPGEVNSVATENTMANYQISYRFHGTSAHAAMEPERGRSALDALELMNTGVQYLREHVPSSTRIHYAITDTGGVSPNVVQANASVLYMVRANKVADSVALQARVDDIAKGAALMTGTSFERVFIDGTAELLPNFTIERALYDNLCAIGVPEYDEADRALASALKKTWKGSGIAGIDGVRLDPKYAKAVKALSENGTKAINDFIPPLWSSTEFSPGSSDVGDVSWLTPTSQISTTCWPAGVPGHSWQIVACGKSALAHKGMLLAGKVLAATAIDLLTDAALLAAAKAEFAERAADGYVCPIEPGAVPIAL